MHRYCPFTGHTKKQKKKCTKYYQIVYKYPAHTKTTIRMKYQRQNYRVKFLINFDLLSTIYI